MLFKYSDKRKLVNMSTIEDAKPGELVIVDYQKSQKGLVANIITISLAKLPEGVSEIKTKELADIVKKDQAAGKYMLIDSRPAPRYADGYIPTAISIPVDDMGKKASLLPADKDVMLIFYCGGHT